MIIEALAIKGLTAICTYAAHHAVAAKVAFTGYKLLKAYSLAQIAITATATCIVVGGVVWGIDRINNLKNGYNAILAGNAKEAIVNFGQLAISLGGVHTLPESVELGLEKLHVPSAQAHKIADWVSSNENAIIKYVYDCK